MDLDLRDIPFNLKEINPGELEEIFEDPFAVKFLPDNDREDGASRYYILGRTVADKHLFATFTTDGKTARVISVRTMSGTERRFYDRNYNEMR